MATITLPHRPHRPRLGRPTGTDQRPLEVVDHDGDQSLAQLDLPDDGPAVPGPDARSAARTAAVVGGSLALLIGLTVLAALGAGEVARSAVEWFMSR